MKPIRLGKTGIEYGDLAWNPFSGCNNWQNGICPVLNCWAKKITERFPLYYPNGFRPTIYPTSLFAPLTIKHPKRILVAFMGELIGCADPEQRIYIPTKTADIDDTFKSTLFNVISECPQSDFLLLTKNPERLPLWLPFPDNAWVGVTVCNNEMMVWAQRIRHIKAKVKYLSFEPLLDWDIGRYCVKYLVNELRDMDIKWAIIGAQSHPTILPRKIWIDEIIDACQRAGIPYWLKNSLVNGFHKDGIEIPRRQELPKR